MCYIHHVVLQTTDYSSTQENFSKASRIQIFDLYPVVGYLFVRCFLILIHVHVFFGGRFGRVSRGKLMQYW